VAASAPANGALSELRGLCLRSGFGSPLKNGGSVSSYRARCRSSARFSPSHCPEAFSS